MIYIIPLAIIFICLVAILGIVIKKLPHLALIDTSTIVREREAAIKRKIIYERLKRNIISVWRIFLKIIKPVGIFLKKEFLKLYKKILELEKHYEEKGAEILGIGALEKKIKFLFNEAEELLRRGEFGEAEKRYIEIISLDKKNLQAYEELGNLYLKTRQYREAEETFSFVLKHNPDDPSILVSFGELFLAKEKPEEALDYFQKAADARPNNPKYLDFLIETSIMVGNKDLARSSLNRLGQVNPENQKIDDFAKRISEIV